MQTFFRIHRERALVELRLVGILFVSLCAMDGPMTKPIARDPIYRKRGFSSEIIELCVRWYVTYRLSYRDLVEMMAERGV